MVLKVGSKKWFIPGFRGYSLIAIKCKITGSTMVGNELAYWVDEPVGYPVYDHYLMSRSEAEKTLRELFKHEKHYSGEKQNQFTFNDWRKWAIQNLKEIKNKQAKRNYPSKTREQWFTIFDLGEKNG